MTKPTILAVDDTPDNLVVVKGALVSDYTVKAVTNGETALKVAQSQPPDLILLDIMMPEMDGYEVCQRLIADERTRDIPIIFLTAMSDEKDETRGLDLGAVDYISKPISIPILKARVRTHVLLKEAKDCLKQQAEILEAKVVQRTHQISQLQDVTMIAMGALAEYRDPETGNHIRRTQIYIKILANHLKEHARFRDYLDPETIELISKSAPLHDIGKVGIPDDILLKPAALTDEEFIIMRKHPEYGRDAIRMAEGLLDEPETFLTLASEIAYSHHEWWDGTGYPQGLAGDDIPVSARLMAVADVYDALISRRVYKPPFSQELSISMIEEKSGSHFDPDMVAAFLELADQFHDISKKYAD